MPCAPALPDAAAAAPVAPELAPAAPPAPPPAPPPLEPVVAEPADDPAGADTVAVVVAGCVFVALPRLVVSTVSPSAVPAWGTGAAMTALCGRLVPRFDAMVTTQSVVELNNKDKRCCSWWTRNDGVSTKKEETKEGSDKSAVPIGSCC